MSNDDSDRFGPFEAEQLCCVSDGTGCFCVKATCCR